MSPMTENAEVDSEPTLHPDTSAVRADLARAEAMLACIASVGRLAVEESGRTVFSALLRGILAATDSFPRTHPRDPRRRVQHQRQRRLGLALRRGSVRQVPRCSGGAGCDDLERRTPADHAR